MQIPDPAPPWWRALAERAAQPPLAPRLALRLGRFVVGSVEAGLAARLVDAGLLGAQGEAGDEAGGEAALARIARWLEGQGLTPRWRDEAIAVAGDDGVERARVDRSAMRALGITSRAVHLVGYTAAGSIWVQQRASDKATDPGKWDTLVGGLVAAGESDAQALERETWEEAGLRLADLGELRCADRITIRRPVREGYMVEQTLVYEAVVPDGVTPENRDGEVECFDCLSAATLSRRLAAGEFTLEASLMMAASLYRRGLLESG